MRRDDVGNMTLHTKVMYAKEGISPRETYVVRYSKYSKRLISVNGSSRLHQRTQHPHQIGRMTQTTLGGGAVGREVVNQAGQDM